MTMLTSDFDYPLPEELIAEDGIGEHSAFLFKLACETLRRYAKDTLLVAPTYRTLSAVSEYLCRKFIGQSTECVYLMLLNNRLSLIDCCKISEGTVNNSIVPIRKITEKMILRKASVVVLAHNHPNGIAIPSQSDLDVTAQIASMFNMMGVQLLEHLIVADDTVFPILQSGRVNVGGFREEILSANPTLLQDFYDIDANNWRFSFFRDLTGKGAE